MPSEVRPRRFLFHVRDATRQILGHFYSEEEPSRRSNMKRLTRDEVVATGRELCQSAKLLRREG
jgi:hypothetical protein